MAPIFVRWWFRSCSLGLVFFGRIHRNHRHRLLAALGWFLPTFIDTIFFLIPGLWDNWLNRRDHGTSWLNSIFWLFFREWPDPRQGPFNLNRSQNGDVKSFVDRKVLPQVCPLS